MCKNIDPECTYKRIKFRLLPILKKRIHHSLIILCLFSTHAFAQVDTTKADTTEGDPYEEELISGVKYADSLLVKVPAYYIYKQWDTVNIHPYKVDLTKMKDTLKIKLTYESKCDFAMPIIGLTTSNFGYRRGRPHFGIDIDLET